MIILHAQSSDFCCFFRKITVRKRSYLLYYYFLHYKCHIQIKPTQQQTFNLFKSKLAAGSSEAEYISSVFTTLYFIPSTAIIITTITTITIMCKGKLVYTKVQVKTGRAEDVVKCVNACLQCASSDAISAKTKQISKENNKQHKGQ